MRRSAGRAWVGLAVSALLAAGLVQAQEAQRRKGFSVQITRPANQEFVFGKTRIEAEVKVEQADLIDRVEFLVGDRVVFVDREAPFECVHDFGEQQRSWIVRAVAYHKEGVSVSDVVVTRKLEFTTIERVNRVILWVSATDPEGALLQNLGRGDFRVFEGSTEQDVIDFQVEERPINLAILLDTSGSMKGKLDEVHQAAGAFVETLRPIDRALIVDFNDRVFLIQDLTSSKDDLRAAITSTEPLGGTAIYDALHAAYRKIGTIEGRKVIVLLSDGDDQSSQLGYKRVLEEAKANNTMIFAIGLGIEGGAPNKGVLEEFADVTGGRYLPVKKAGQLAEVYRRIAEELGRQYYLTYQTTNQEWDGHWVPIEVRSTKPGIQIRARRGYFAVRGAAGGS